jgi:hypothetical protein
LFTPEAVLNHRIPVGRMSRRYLFRIIRQLGASSALIGALTGRVIGNHGGRWHSTGGVTGIGWQRAASDMLFAIART